MCFEYRSKYYEIIYFFVCILSYLFRINHLSPKFAQSPASSSYALVLVISLPIMSH